MQMIDPTQAAFWPDVFSERLLVHASQMLFCKSAFEPLDRKDLAYCARGWEAACSCGDLESFYQAMEAFGGKELERLSRIALPAAEQAMLLASEAMDRDSGGEAQDFCALGAEKNYAQSAYAVEAALICARQCALASKGPAGCHDPAFIRSFERLSSAIWGCSKLDRQAALAVWADALATGSKELAAKGLGKLDKEVISAAASAGDLARALVESEWGPSTRDPKP